MFSTIFKNTSYQNHFNPNPTPNLIISDLAAPLLKITDMTPDSAPTPSTHTEVTIRHIDGTEVTYTNIVYMVRSKILIFNGPNSSIEVDKSKVSTVVVKGHPYVINRIESLSEDAWQMRLE